jgi:hypothetical protein
MGVAPNDPSQDDWKYRDVPARAIPKGMRVILPDVVGGIGNQIFFFASAFAHALLTKRSLVFDDRQQIYSWGKNRKNYRSSVFSRIPIVAQANMNIVPWPSVELRRGNYWCMCSASHCGPLNASSDPTADHVKMSNFADAEAYFQRPSYWHRFRSHLLVLLEPPRPILQQAANKMASELHPFVPSTSPSSSNSTKLICVHLRFPDAATPVGTPMESGPQFKGSTVRAISMFAEEGYKTFAVFSNDPVMGHEYLADAQNIAGSRIVHMGQTLTDYETLYAFGFCDGFVATPSTFIFWGVYLNPRLGGSYKLPIRMPHKAAGLLRQSHEGWNMPLYATEWVSG